MSVRSEQFTPYQCAYSLEGQGIIVKIAEANGLLRQRVVTLKSIVNQREQGEDWVRLSYGERGVINLYPGDCDEQIVLNLQPEQKLLVVYAVGEKKEAFGRPEHAIAAVRRVGDSTPLFCVKGFDFVTYERRFLT